MDINIDGVIKEITETALDQALDASFAVLTGILGDEDHLGDMDFRPGRRLSSDRASVASPVTSVASREIRRRNCDGWLRDEGRGRGCAALGVTPDEVERQTQTERTRKGAPRRQRMANALVLGSSDEGSSSSSTPGSLGSLPDRRRGRDRRHGSNECLGRRIGRLREEAGRLAA